ncbi:MAG: deoxyribose-phosphate aldolase [Ferruginibacter sp.]
MQIASFIEHSFLDPTATLADLERVCNEAMQFNFAAICVPPLFVKKAKVLSTGSNLKIATVVGFPFGYNVIEAKVAETVLAIVDGADEINMMINMLALKNNDWQWLAKEINTILTVVRKAGKIIKVIIEAGLLTREEIIACCDIYGAAGIDYIQTSTGYCDKVMSLETFLLIRKHLADPIQLKHGDAIDTVSLNTWISAGANRIVCKDPVIAVKRIANDTGGMIFDNEHANKNLT